MYDEKNVYLSSSREFLTIKGFKETKSNSGLFDKQNLSALSIPHQEAKNLRFTKKYEICEWEKNIPKIGKLKLNMKEKYCNLVRILETEKFKIISSNILPKLNFMESFIFLEFLSHTPPDEEKFIKDPRTYQFESSFLNIVCSEFRADTQSTVNFEIFNIVGQTDYLVPTDPDFEEVRKSYGRLQEKLRKFYVDEQGQPCRIPSQAIISF